VDAHGIEIFDGADDDDIVFFIPHDFQFVFLPTNDGLLDEDFIDAGIFDSAGADGFKFFGGSGDATAVAAECETGTDHAGQADFLEDFSGIFHGIGQAAFWQLEIDFFHGFFEEFAVFRLVDGVAGGADHFYIIGFECATVCHFDGGIESGLAAQGRQEGVDRFSGFPLRLENLDNGIGGHRFDVGPIGKLGVRHDGGGIGVDQNNFVAFFT